MVRTEYIKQAVPAPPPVPEYYGVRFAPKDGGYWLDSDNAKNLLKNWTLKSERESDMQEILESFQSSTL